MHLPDPPQCESVAPSGVRGLGHRCERVGWRRPGSHGQCGSDRGFVNPEEVPTVRTTLTVATPLVDLAALYPRLQPTHVFEAGGIFRKVELHHDAITQRVNDADGLPINITVRGSLRAPGVARQEF